MLGQVAQYSRSRTAVNFSADPQQLDLELMTSLSTFYAASYATLLRRHLADRSRIEWATAQNYPASVLQSMLDPLETVFEDFDTLTLASDELLTNRVPGRWTDPMAWLSEWEHEFQRVINIPFVNYRKGSFPVRPHPLYSTIEVGKFFLEMDWLPCRRSPRELVSVGKGFAILLEDYKALQRMMSHALVTDSPNNLRRRNLPRLLAYALFPNFEPGPSSASTCSFGFLREHSGQQFQVSRYHCIGRE
jgi:hypothetical protein